jgi:hypothetical protein
MKEYKTEPVRIPLKDSDNTKIYLVPRRQPIISCLHHITSAVVVVVWYPFWKFVSPSRRFVCDSHTNSRPILNISATNQQQTNVFINNRPTLSSRALQGDSNATKIIANGLVVTATFRLLYYCHNSKFQLEPSTITNS